MTIDTGRVSNKPRRIWSSKQHVERVVGWVIEFGLVPVLLPAVESCELYLYGHHLKQTLDGYHVVLELLGDCGEVGNTMSGQASKVRQ